MKITDQQLVDELIVCHIDKPQIVSIDAGDIEAFKKLTTERFAMKFESDNLTDLIGQIKRELASEDISESKCILMYYEDSESAQFTLESLNDIIESVRNRATNADILWSMNRCESAEKQLSVVLIFGI